MEPFRLTRERVTFLALMAVVTVVVAVAAPFGSIALSAVALLALGAVLIRAMLRTRSWWPLSAVEGTVALSGVVLLAGGLAVAAYSIVRLGVGDPFGMMVGWPYVDPTRAGTRTRAVSYSDPSMQQRLKEALREAGIPFTVKMDDGKEFVGWSGEHNAAADAINEKVKAGPLRSGRNSHFPDATLQKEFTQWLSKRGVKHEVVQMEGKDWVVWDESAGDVVRVFMESRGGRDCKGKVAAGKPGEMPC